jgi:uncharacterized protein
VRTLLLSGGVGHPFDQTSSALAELLGEVGVAAEVTDDIEGGLAELDHYDLLTVNALRWRMLAERYAHLREEWSMTLSAEGRASIEQHLAQGRGVLAIHTAAICFDDWPGWGRIVGGAWDWDRSSHPPLGPARVRVSAHGHPLTSGIDDFDILDEVYGFMALEDDVQPLLTSAHGGADHPLLWARTHRGARVAYDALGHDMRSYEHPTHRLIVRRLGRWITGATDEEVASQT